MQLAGGEAAGEEGGERSLLSSGQPTHRCRSIAHRPLFLVTPKASCKPQSSDTRAAPPRRPGRGVRVLRRTPSTSRRSPRRGCGSGSSPRAGSDGRRRPDRVPPRLHRIPIRWLTRIEVWEPGARFVDVQIRGPYRLWHHTHTFERPRRRHARARPGALRAAARAARRARRRGVRAPRPRADLRLPPGEVARTLGDGTISDPASQSLGKANGDVLETARVSPPLPRRGHRLLRACGGRDGRRACSSRTWSATRSTRSASGCRRPLAARGRGGRGRRAAARVQRLAPAGGRHASRSGWSTTCATACTSTCTRWSSGSSTCQQTGQLMSRATVDLQSVRFFLGYGLIFILQSALTILIAAGVMLAVDPELAAVSLAPMPFVIWMAFRYGRRNRPASQEVQQRIAELTAEAEENIGGVRVVKAFAQEERQLRRFRHAVRRVFDQSMVSTRLRAFYSPFIGFLPQLGLAARAVRGRPPGDQRANHGRRVRRLLRLRAACSPRRCGCSASRSAWRSARWRAGSACSSCSTASRGSRRRPGRRRCRAGGGRVELRDVGFDYEGAEPVLRDIDLDGRGGPDGRARRARPARARRRS